MQEGSGSLPQHMIRKYEKKIRKTHRVANVTEQNLKRQQASLMHFKKELSLTMGKLQELADKGDEHAIKRLKSIRVKLQQIDKILPYIGKYIMVNRQAEIQTVAILKESCTVDMQRMKGGGGGGGAQAHTPAEVESERLLVPHKPLETHVEEAESSSPAEHNLPPTEALTSPALPPGEQPGGPEVSPHTAGVEPTEPAPPPPLSSPELEEEQQHISPSQPLSPRDSPYAKLESMQAEVERIHKQVEGREAENSSPAIRESPYATLASVRPADPAGKSAGNDEVQYAEIVKVISPALLSPPSAPKSPYAELDFSRMQQQEQQTQQQQQQQQQHRLTPTSPRSRLNYVEVSFNSSKSKGTIIDDTDSKSHDNDTTLVAAGERDNTKENSVLDETLTHPDQGRGPLMNTFSPSHSSPASKSRAAALQDAIKLFEPAHSSTPTKAPSSKPGPPLVKKKPKQGSTSSSNRSSLHQESTPSPSHTAAIAAENSGNTRDTELSSEDGSLLPSASSETQSVATGSMSVLERIKVSNI